MLRFTGFTLLRIEPVGPGPFKKIFAYELKQREIGIFCESLKVKSALLHPGGETPLADPFA